MDTAVPRMQKSKSSGNVVHMMSRKIWRGRSKSQTRLSSSQQSPPPVKAHWSPQGNGVWTSSEGCRIQLIDVDLDDLSVIERKMLQRVATAKLKELNFGATIPPCLEDGVASVEKKSKRRPYLLKRKALTTGFFDSTKKEVDDSRQSASTATFGISLEHCLANEVQSLKASSRSSSCESLPIPDSMSSAESLHQPQDENNIPRVPAIVKACIHHLMTHGLNTIGIFRVSPARRRVRRLREEWERAGPRGINLDSTHCPHDVATLLKEFFRDLPEPLLCRSLCKMFVDTQRIRNRRMQLEAISHLIQLLPTANRDTLKVLLKFLGNVARCASGDGPNNYTGNRMDSTNLATVFAPNILPTADDVIDDRFDAINVIRIMIDHQQELFRIPASLLDEIYAEMIDSNGQALDRLCEQHTSKTTTATATTHYCDDDIEKRRMSSPLVLHGGGVLSASLSIPVTMNTQLNVGDHYEDIPFIEDSSISEDSQQQQQKLQRKKNSMAQRPLVTVTGTLSISEPRSIERKKQQQQQETPSMSAQQSSSKSVIRSKTENFDHSARVPVHHGSVTGDKRPTPLVYKRREIISSVHSSRK
ncbi:hypothetical protein DMENIID0001_070630 [Sergentomyia squamirostris]